MCISYQKITWEHEVIVSLKAVGIKKRSWQIQYNEVQTRTGTKREKLMIIT